MSIELKMESCLDDLSKYETLLNNTEELCKVNHYPFHNYEDYISINICEEGLIYIELEDKFLTISTNTNVAGPGYHAFCCEFFKAIEELNDGIDFNFTDDTKFIINNNFDLLMKNFDLYLSEVIKQSVELKEKGNEIYVNWPSNYYLPEDKVGYLISNMGYLSMEQLGHIDIKSIAKQYYIWYERKVNASFYVNSALCLLWRECYYEASCTNEYATNVAYDILRYIEKAYELDNTIALPYKEYIRLCKIVNKDIVIENANDMGLHDIGYRNNKVSYTYEDWLIFADGMCDISYDDNTLILNSPIYNDDKTWKYTIYLNGYRFEKSIENFSTFNSIGDVIKEIHEERDDMRIKAIITKNMDENNTEYYTLEAQVIVDNCLLMILSLIKDMNYYDVVKNLLDRLKLSHNENENILH